MNQFHHKFLRLFFVITSLLGVGSVLSSNERVVKATTNEEQLVTSFTSSSLATTSTYQKYENNDWLMTMGSSNGIGASNSYASRLTLGTYSSLMFFDSSISSESKYLTALISKNTIRNLSSIRISRGSSYGAYLSTKVYLVKSSSLDGNYEHVTTIETVGTTPINYSFPPISESQYYALVFYNPSGSFIIGGLTIHFYSSNVVTYSKVTDASQLYFGATYTLVDETSQKVISFDQTSSGYRGVSTKVSHSQIEEQADVLKFKLDVGVMIDTYSFQLLNGHKFDDYLAIEDNNSLTSSITNLVQSAFSLKFDNGFIDIDADDSHLVFDEETDEFMFSTLPSNISLYLLNEPIDHLREVSVFISEVNIRGENVSGYCSETYLFLNSIYLRLSEEGVNLFLTSNDSYDISAKNRMTYLENWYNDTQPVRKVEGVVQTNYLPILFIIGLSTTSILIYAYIKHKKRLL